MPWIGVILLVSLSLALFQLRGGWLMRVLSPGCLSRLSHSTPPTTMVYGYLYLIPSFRVTLMEFWHDVWCENSKISHY